MIELNQELDILRRMGEYVDEQLTQMSFRKADTLARRPEEARPGPAAPPAAEKAIVRSVRSRTGVNLATVSYTRDEVRFQLSPAIELRSDDKPFTSFLLRKVLDPMADKDRRKVEAGELDEAKALSYDIVYDGDRVKEILVRNYKGEARLRELINSVRWTLETVSSR